MRLSSRFRSGTLRSATRDCLAVGGRPTRSGGDVLTEWARDGVGVFVPPFDARDRVKEWREP